MPNKLTEARLKLSEARMNMRMAADPWRHAMEKESKLWITIKCLVAAIDLMADSLDGGEDAEELEPDCEHCSQCVNDGETHCCMCKDRLTPEERDRHRGIMAVKYARFKEENDAKMGRTL